MASSLSFEAGTNTLLVFDYATTGSDPTRDRPVEFACLRLDRELNVIGTPTTLHCKPASDHLSGPAACLIHGVTPQFCEQVGLSELDFVDAVRRQLSTPGTVSFGYNSIAFDAEITRFMFWRNSSTRMRTNGRTDAAGGM